MPRPERLAGPAAVLVAVGLAVLPVAACNDTRDLAPADAVSPWQTAVKSGDGPVRTGAAPGRYDLPPDRALPLADPHPAIDAQHRYTLVELIDVAQANNKETRIAWEQARQAAIGVGIARAAYLPTIALSALGGYRRITEQFPTNVVRSGYIVGNAVAVFPALSIGYLLVDFGARRATEQAAEQQSFAANVAFTAAHQQVILAVSRAFFDLQAAEAALGAARVAADNTRLLDQDAGARLQHGEGTVTDVDDAKRGVAQARYDIAAATSARNTARDTLLGVLGVAPQTRLQVAPLEGSPVPDDFGATLDELMHEALRQRPDLLADLARLRGSEARVALARSSLFPTLSIDAKANDDYGVFSVDHGPTKTFNVPTAGLYLDFNWTLYQGGLRANRIRLAQSEASEARDRLEQAEDDAMREVAIAYDALDSSLTEYRAAQALHAAASLSFQARSAAFGTGVGTLTDADTARTALDQADATLVRTHAQMLEAAAALAFATGGLTQARP